MLLHSPGGSPSFCIPTTLRLALALMICATPMSARAQVSVSGVRNLQFGFVAGGVPTVVAPGDPVKSGQWNLTAPVGTKVQIRITTPTQLIRTGGGGTMPAVFLNGDVFIQGNWNGAVVELFNPNATKNFQFTGGTTAFIRLGGRVTPAGNQATGPYANTVICTIIVN